MSTILVVDDEPVVRDVVVKYLRRDGFATLEAADGDRARDLIEQASPALVVLDVMLPGTDGLELCRWLGRRGGPPVILLTARVEEADRIVGLELGADDYVTKPFSPRELSARVRAVLRRAASPPVDAAPVEFGEVVVDAGARRVTVGGVEVSTTPKEFDLLWLLARNPGTVMSRETLMESVWGYTLAIDTGTVSVHIRRLREKIEPDPSAPRYLQTVWGVGYRFAA